MHKLTLKELRTKLINGETTAVLATQDVLKQILAKEPQIKAYLNVFKDQALKQAEQADKKLQKDAAAAYKAQPLLGIPLSIKDNLNLLSTEMTCASKIMKGYVSCYTATAVQKLQDAGAVILGKTNLDEFAMGSSTENSAFQKTANPWDAERVPGGSSGGSAAAVAADECFGSLGSETGGSLRQPAAFCGVVGLRPTYGLVSRNGLTAFASSLDQIGPITKTVEDAALMLNVLAGNDALDPVSVNLPPQDYTALLAKEIKNIKIAVLKGFENIEPGVQQAVQTAIAELKDQGAIIEEIEIPVFKYAPAVYYVISAAEASSNLARIDGVRFGQRTKGPKDAVEMYKRSRGEGFGAEVKRRLMLGTYFLSTGRYTEYFLQAQKVRTLIREDYAKIFAQYDAVLSPTAFSTAFKFGSKASDLFSADLAAIPASLAGLPAISVPCGIADGLPVGLQLVAKEFEEQKLLQIAAAVERSSKFERIHL